MRATSILAVTAALMAPAMADFYVYYGIQYITVDASSTTGYHFYTGPPSCDDVYNDVAQTPRDDVSSGEGVRCKGCSTAEDNDVQVTELEFANDDWGHYTFYANRDGALVDLDDNVVGTCNIDNSDSYNCFDGLATYKGQSQIFCSTTLAIP